MHPPLFKPHPLCKKVRCVAGCCCKCAQQPHSHATHPTHTHMTAQEVEDLVACHENNPFMKFLNACGETKMKMDACFKVIAAVQWC